MLVPHGDAVPFSPGDLGGLLERDLDLEPLLDMGDLFLDLDLDLDLDLEREREGDLLLRGEWDLERERERE